MANNFRYPGPNSFSFEQRSIFFGRDEDIANLRTSVIVNPTTVLFGISGTGKSSLIQAGLIPKLLESGDDTHVPFLVIDVMPKVWDQSKILWEEIENILKQKIDQDIDFLQLPELKATSSLWYLLKGLQFKQHQDKTGQTVLLIFDQCEEIFTYPDAQMDKLVQEIYPVIGQFIPEKFQKIISAKKLSFSPEQIKILFEPLVIKFLFSIRSDKLHLITRLKKASPYILQNSYELLPLTKQRAFEAIEEPSKAEGDFISEKFTITNEAKEFIFNELAVPINDTEENFENYRIDPFSLQIICSYLEINIAPKNKIIGKDNFEKPNKIILGYYQDSINQLKATDEEKIRVRNFIELKLLQNNRRIPIHEDLILGDEKYPLSKELLNELVAHKILKKDNSVNGGSIYEITHDCFIKPIAEARDQRLGKSYESQSLDTINELLRQIHDKENAGGYVEQADTSSLSLKEVIKGQQAGNTGITSSTNDFDLCDLYKRLGDAYMVVKDYKQAIQSFTKAIKTEPNQQNTSLIELYRSRASAYALTQNYPDSNNDYSTILEFKNDDYSALYAIGQNHKDSGNYTEAIEYWQKAASASNGNGGIYTDIGNIYFSNKEYEQAKSYYLKTLQINLNADYAWSNLGLVAISMNDPDEALANYKKAVDINPIATTFNTIGNIYFDKKDYESAMLNYQKALNLDINYYYSIYNIGLIEATRGNMDAALYNYKRTIESNPNYENAYVAMGAIYFDRKEFIKAKEMYEDLISINPNEKEYYKDFGTIEEKLGDWDAAIRHFKKSVELDQDHNEVNFIFNEIGRCYFNLSDWTNAEINFNEAIKLKPDNYEYINNLCATKINMGDFENAEKLFKRTLELKQDYPLAYYNHGYQLEKMNNKSEAINNYKKCLELNPEYSDAKDRLAALENAEIKTS